MELLGGVLLVVGWFWSLRAGIMVSLTCCILNFIFTPVAQLIFCIYEPVMRPPTVLMAVGGIVLVLSQSDKPAQQPIEKERVKVVYQYNHSLQLKRNEGLT